MNEEKKYDPMYIDSEKRTKKTLEIIRNELAKEITENNRNNIRLEKLELLYNVDISIKRILELFKRFGLVGIGSPNTLIKRGSDGRVLEDSLVSEDGTEITVSGSLTINDIDSITSCTNVLTHNSNTVNQITMPNLSASMRRKITIVGSYPYYIEVDDDVVVGE